MVIFCDEEKCKHNNWDATLNSGECTCKYVKVTLETEDWSGSPERNWYCSEEEVYDTKPKSSS